MLRPYKDGNGLQYRATYGENFGKVLSRLQGTTVSFGTRLQHAVINLSPTLKKGKPDIHGLGLAIELKTGVAFDVKKARAEIEDLVRHANDANLNPALCCFLADDIQSIEDEFKTDLTGILLLTGRELCELAKMEFGLVLETAGLTNSKSAREELLYLLKEANELDNS